MLPSLLTGPERGTGPGVKPSAGESATVLPCPGPRREHPSHASGDEAITGSRNDRRSRPARVLAGSPAPAADVGPDHPRREKEPISHPTGPQLETRAADEPGGGSTRCHDTPRSIVSQSAPSSPSPRAKGPAATTLARRGGWLF